MARQDGYVRYTLRIPPEVYDRFVAEVGERSVNSAIVERLNSGGETLRDRFAMAALSAIARDRELKGYSVVGIEAGKWMAEQAYGLADAMLAERQKGGA